jgi:hypothetical protein
MIRESDWTTSLEDRGLVAYMVYLAENVSDKAGMSLMQLGRSRHNNHLGGNPPKNRALSHYITTNVQYIRLIQYSFVILVRIETRRSAASGI